MLLDPRNMPHLNCIPPDQHDQTWALLRSMVIAVMDEVKNADASVDRVLLFLFKPILGNHYGPGFSSPVSQGGQTHDPRSLISLLTLSPVREPGVSGSSPCNLTKLTSLAILIFSFSSSNGPTTTALSSEKVQSSFSLIGEGPEWW